MYTFPSTLKITALSLIVVGLLGIAYGFLSAPSTVAEAQAMVADAHHGESHAPAAEHASDASTHQAMGHEAGAVAHEEQAAHEADDHGEHLLHQLQNKPWAAVYVAAFFFMMLALGTLAFYAIQRAAQAGWSPVLFRVMEGITGYLLPGTLIVFVLLVLSGMHWNHLFIWMDPEVVAHDKLIQGKTGFLNVPFFLSSCTILYSRMERVSLFFKKILNRTRYRQRYQLPQKKLQNICWFSSVFYRNRVDDVLGLDHVHRPTLV